MNSIKILHIDTKNYEEKDENGETNIQVLNNTIKNGTPVFLLIYMEGCGPCNATRPEWKKIENVLKGDILKNDALIVDIDKDMLDKVNNIGTSPKGFPTIRYVSNKNVEDFEDCALSDEYKNRTIDSFVNWITYKLKEPKGSDDKNVSDVSGGKRRTTGKRRSSGKRRKSGKMITGGKWSRKYKKSINCNRPKGFSQKQYCKYSRKK